MKKIIIASLVGAIIMFVYTFLSWMVLPTHKTTLKYISAQDTIIQQLSSQLTENGMYGLPTHNPNATLSMDEHKAEREKMVGRPFAMVLYNKSFPGLQPSMLAMSVLLNFIAILMVTLVLSTFSGASFGKKWMIVMVAPIIICTQSHFYNMTFWQYPWHYVSGEVVDAFLGWALAGLWLAWYMGRTVKN